MKRILWLLFVMVGWVVAQPEGHGLGGEGQGAEEVDSEAGDVLTEEAGFTEIPEAYGALYFETRPDDFLCDPQQLLSPVVRRDRSAFLRYHAGDSSIDLYVYLIAGGQKLPEESRCEEMVRKFFGEGKPAAVVFYPLGEPDRAALYLSPALEDQVSGAESKRALASAVMQAVEKADPAGQLEMFLVQMSIRLYWMEQMMAKKAEVEIVPEKRVELVQKQREKPEVSVREKLEPVVAVMRSWVKEAGAVIGVVMVLLLVFVWSRLRARHVLPDFAVEPRLGGEHGAGVGAVISFASAAVPPASQRDRIG